VLQDRGHAGSPDAQRRCARQYLSTVQVTGSVSLNTFA
jgi:hypothetical protein